MAAVNGRGPNSFGQAFTPITVSSGETPPEVPVIIRFIYAATRRIFGRG